MEWSIAQSADAAVEMAASNIPNLRFFDVPKVAYEDGIERNPAWKVSAPENAGAFSAVAYHFAKRVIAELHMPIGIIGCNWGGTSASCWVSESVLMEDPELRIYADEFKLQLKDFDAEAFKLEERSYNIAVAEYSRKFEAGLRGKELGEYPWPLPFHPDYWLRPYGIYSTMLLKVVPYALKGFLYYQGESDAHRPLIYVQLMIIGFEIAGESLEYHPAQALLQGKTVVLWSEQVEQPVAVRYAWANYTEANLFNSFGLPAGPFRTHREERAD